MAGEEEKNWQSTYQGPKEMTSSGTGETIIIITTLRMNYRGTEEGVRQATIVTI